MCVNTHVIPTRAAILTATQRVTEPPDSVHTRALLPLTDSIPRRRRSDVAVGVADDLSVRRVGTTLTVDAETRRSRETPFLSPRARIIDRIGPINSRWIDRVAERVPGECATAFSLYILIGGPARRYRGRESRADTHANTRVLHARRPPTVIRDVTDVIIYQWARRWCTARRKWSLTGSIDDRTADRQEIAKRSAVYSVFYMLAHVLIVSSRARFTMPRVFRLFLYPPAVARGRCSISLLFLCISMIEGTVWLAINYIYRGRIVEGVRATS